MQEAARSDDRPPQAPDLTEEMAEALAWTYPKAAVSCGPARETLRRAAPLVPRLGKPPASEHRSEREQA